MFGGQLVHAYQSRHTRLGAVVMNVSMQYADAWESFWRDVPQGAGAALWDAAPERTVALHLPLLQRYTAADLPLVDVGCGNGTQSLHLTRRYARVVGFDLSEAAVARAGQAAREAHTESATFRQLDATDTDAVREVHGELGDADVYMRGVLHQSLPDDRPLVAASVAALVGERGRALVVEPAAAAKQVLLRLMGRSEGPPPQVEAVFGHGIAPMEMPDEALPRYFRDAGLTVLGSGTMPLPLTIAEDDGSPVALPSTWLAVGRNP